MCPFAIEASQFPGPQKDGGKHHAVEPSRVGVAQGGMVAAEQVQAVRQPVLGAMREEVCRPALDCSGLQQLRKIPVPSNFAETDDDPDVRQGVEFGEQMLGAGADLRRSWLVAGRCTANDGGDPGVAEFEAVGGGDGAGFVREAEVIEDRIHEVAGAVSGKDAPCAVGSVGSGCKSKDE